MHWREQMSALVDGELSPDEVVELMDAIERDPGLKTVWSRYQSMGPLLARANDLQPEARAANDSVFWRRLAVAASVVAATTLMWGVVDHHSTAEPTLAMAPESVWMSSAVGPMLRDPVLEELLQQHREWGDGGALQTSTGFLRSATLQYTP
jgi:negative regulator of sigma E activity